VARRRRVEVPDRCHTCDADLTAFKSLSISRWGDQSWCGRLGTDARRSSDIVEAGIITETSHPSDGDNCTPPTALHCHKCGYPLLQGDYREEPAELSPSLPAPPTAEALRDIILTTVRFLDVQHRYQGLVPLPALRHELQRLGIDATQSTVDAAVIE